MAQVLPKSEIQPAYDKRLCFLIGCPRSGTTWLRQLLETHPQICSGPESYFFSLFASPIRQAHAMRERNIGPLMCATDEHFENAIRELWNNLFDDLYSANPDCEIHLEKTPHHALELDEIVSIFPDAKVIVLLRDSRAVASSLFHAGHDWGSHWAPTTYKDAATMWWSYMSAIRRWRAANPSHPCLVLRFEDALKDPTKTVREALDYLSLPYDGKTIKSMFDQYDINSRRSKMPKGKTRKRGASGWQKDMSLRGKLVVWRYTRKMMRDLGYDCRLFD